MALEEKIKSLSYNGIRYWKLGFWKNEYSFPRGDMGTIISLHSSL